MATPNMNLDLPVPGVGGTAGPEYAQKLNTAIETVDEHDHTSGKGVQIPTAGMNINADLDFSSFNATGLRSVRLDNQTGELTGVDDLRILYAENGELIYRDGSGNPVQITTGGSVAGASGTISGLGPPTSSTASYSDDTKSFTFNYAASKPGKLNISEISVYEFDNATANTITIKSPASVGASYDITLPSAVPTKTAPMTMSGSGVQGTTELDEEQVLKGTGAGGVAAGYGLVPVGTVVAMFDNSVLPGAFVPPTLLSGDVKQGWMRCDGSSVPAGQIITSGTTLPDLTDDRFIMGDTGASLTPQSSNTKDLSHSHTVDNHRHSMQSHTHGMENHTHDIAHTHMFMRLIYPRYAMNAASYVTSTDISDTSGNEKLRANDVPNGTGAINTYTQVISTSSERMYTTGVIDPPTGSGGGSARTGAPNDNTTSGPSSSNTGYTQPGTDSQLSSSQDIKPKYLSAIYLIRVG